VYGLFLCKEIFDKPIKPDFDVRLFFLIMHLYKKQHHDNRISLLEFFESDSISHGE